MHRQQLLKKLPKLWATRADLWYVWWRAIKLLWWLLTCLTELAIEAHLALAGERFRPIEYTDASIDTRWGVLALFCLLALETDKNEWINFKRPATCALGVVGRHLADSRWLSAHWGCIFDNVLQSISADQRFGWTPGQNDYSHFSEFMCFWTQAILC